MKTVFKLIVVLFFISGFLGCSGENPSPPSGTVPAVQTTPTAQAAPPEPPLPTTTLNPSSSGIGKIGNDISMANSISSTISENDILRSTVSIYVWQVLGWYYKESQSPLWTKGSEELAAVGKKSSPKEKNVRAVCLGEENGQYVFFTLRSFIDPAYPNPFIQGISTTPLGKDGQSIFSGEPASGVKGQLTRYGGISLAWYKDLGGGDLVVEQKVSIVTHADMDSPKDYGSMKYMASTEKINNISYEVPHEKISAAKHLSLQKAFQQGLNATIKVFDSHDVALVYVPKSAFQPEYTPPSLGIANPSLVSQLFLEHSQEIFGFKFVLMGQETMDLIRGYTPPKIIPSEMSGFEKLFVIAGLAMSSTTIVKLKIIDAALNSAIPNEFLKVKNIDDAKMAALSIVGNSEFLQKLKMLIIK